MSQNHTLLVATSGGHIEELELLSQRIQGLGAQRWVTNETSQTRVMCKSKDMEFVPFIDSRDFKGVLREIPHAIKLLRKRPKAVVSTGSAIALAYLPLAALMGVEAHYIESVARVQAPSVTGRVLERIPGIQRWWQFRKVPSQRWSAIDGIFSDFQAEPIVPHEIKKVVVTVGTTEYCFRRLIQRLVEIIPAEIEVLWQVGNSNVDGLDIEAQKLVDKEVLQKAISQADVVVCHAGAGTLLNCLQAGKIPVYVPRRFHVNEQVDDHQTELARWAASAGLAIKVEADAVTWADLQTAASKRCIENAPSTIELFDTN